MFSPFHSAQPHCSPQEYNRLGRAHPFPLLLLLWLYCRASVCMDCDRTFTWAIPSLPIMHFFVKKAKQGNSQDEKQGKSPSSNHPRKRDTYETVKAFIEQYRWWEHRRCYGAKHFISAGSCTSDPDITDAAVSIIFFHACSILPVLHSWKVQEFCNNRKEQPHRG